MTFVKRDRNLRNRVSQITKASQPRFCSETRFLTPTRSHPQNKARSPISNHLKTLNRLISFSRA
ncbi:hypothetical protein [Kamptonema sp. UHCC 0994]|uniref:hypothetical protein n=1 Tax=Kamptonema sp. UHCC 0994 TaxID=3031329 RepID=UPI0023BB02AC|nr:hypothetical protein [Kamptonema sp. UHCC 0994]MDF0556324.1 hypothetical protein [Kamptonema sp. UHCC 0994]